MPPPETLTDEGLVADNVEASSGKTQVLDAMLDTLKAWQQKGLSLKKIKHNCIITIYCVS